MSLIVTVSVPTGIIMSGDSRSSFIPPNTQETLPDAPPPIPTGLIISDSTYKVFLLYGRYGVSTCGISFINEMPVAHHVEAFEHQNESPPESPHALAEALLAYFRAMDPVPPVSFQVSGYDSSNEAYVGFVNVSANIVVRSNNTSQQKYGLWWAGDLEIASRLAAQANVPWNSLNVQDAIDFSRHLIRSTIDQMRFELRFPTVGGPIDTLLISPKKSVFLLRKELQCN